MPTRKETAAAIEQAVTDALVREGYDEAIRLLDGHPDKKWITHQMARISVLREGGADVDDEGEEEGREEDEEQAEASKGTPSPWIMFSLDHQAVLISTFTPGKLSRGKVKMRAYLGATALDAFDPSLRPWLFCHKGLPRTDMVDEAEDVPDIRVEQLKHVEWKGTYPGYRLAVWDKKGISDDPPRRLVDAQDCTLHAIKFTPAEHGMVHIDWTVDMPIDEPNAGALSMLVNETADITLRPPENPQAEIPLGRGEPEEVEA